MAAEPIEPQKQDPAGAELLGDLNGLAAARSGACDLPRLVLDTYRAGFLDRLDVRKAWIVDVETVGAAHGKPDLASLECRKPLMPLPPAVVAGIAQIGEPQRVHRILDREHAQVALRARDTKQARVGG